MEDKAKESIVNGAKTVQIRGLLLRSRTHMQMQRQMQMPMQAGGGLGTSTWCQEKWVERQAVRSAILIPSPINLSLYCLLAQSVAGGLCQRPLNLSWTPNTRLKQLSIIYS